LPTSAELRLLDTSAAVAYVDEGSVFHRDVLAATRGHPLGMAGHAAYELLSVLTRQPGPKRLDGADVLLLLEEQFPHSRFLGPGTEPALLREFVGLGILGGAVYDGLVGAAARAHGLILVTCDRRAKSTYDALGVAYQLLA
jgi:predicted nucleic acid-binding protein